MRKAFASLLAAVAALALAWGIAAALAGGLSFTLGGLQVRSTNYWRPIAAGLAAAAIAVAINGWHASRTDLSRIAAGVTAARAAGALAILTTILGLAASSWTASGPDSYAYLSNAALWREGRLTMPVDLANEAPWPDAATTFAPFGYRARYGGTPVLVPVTAPGLPLLMAGLQKVAGHCAAFLVTPIAAGALVWLTFAIGRRLASPAAGLIAAWLLATSPALLFMLMWPMSDIPAAAWTAAMIVLLLARSPAAAFAAGLAASAGALTRGTLALVAVAAVSWLVVEAVFPRPSEKTESSRWRRVAMFGLGLVPGMALTAWLNSQWYGSPLASGYGPAEQLFSLSRLGTNTSQYLSWLAATSPLALIGIPALLWPTTRLWPTPGARRGFLLLGLVAASAVGPYLVYRSYEYWWYLRFLLPAWPALFVATAVVCDTVRRRDRMAAVVVLLVVVAAGLFGIVAARGRGVFEIGAEERRYVTVATLVAEATEPDSVILTGLHAGTLRYYAGRDTLRWDVLDPAWLDRAVSWFVARGRHPYLLVEDWEHPVFNARFGRINQLGDLAFTPALAWQSTRVRGWVFLYDPLRRDQQTRRPGSEVERTRPWCAEPAHREGPR